MFVLHFAPNGQNYSYFSPSRPIPIPVHATTASARRRRLLGEITYANIFLESASMTTFEDEQGNPMEAPRGIFHYSDTEQNVESKFKVPDFQEVCFWNCYVNNNYFLGSCFVICLCFALDGSSTNSSGFNVSRRQGSNQEKIPRWIQYPPSNWRYSYEFTGLFF